MADYRISSKGLFDTLSVWDEMIPGRGKIHLVACGGTALTLLGYKESTKDVDFLVPIEGEYVRLVKFLKSAGYSEHTGFGWKRAGETIIFDLYPGKKVYTTELLDSPLDEKRNKKIREWKRIYLGALNPIDLIISKMFRGNEVDTQDCLILLEHEKVNLKELDKRYKETAKYEVNEEKVLRNYEMLLRRLNK